MQLVPLPRPTPGRADSPAAASTSAPYDEMVQHAARRLAFGAIVVAFIYGVYLVLYLLVWPGNTTSRVVATIVILASAAVAFFAYRPSSRAGQIAAIGLAYEVLICLSIAVIEYWKLPALAAATHGVSWVAIIIILFPILVPARPRTTLGVALLAATMSPVGYLIDNAVLGREGAPGTTVLSWFLPQYLCAMMAYGLARVLGAMGKDVQRARRLGSYELIERIGEGGMGEVWRARHRLLVRPAAIKVIKAIEAGSQASVRERMGRFEREAQATAALGSPHTVSLYDFGVSQTGEFYYVMELLVGMDLDHLVRRFGPMPAARVVSLLRQACASLGEAHAAGLIHRDIKPGNLHACRLGGRCDFLKVLDFGLVRWEHRSGEDDALRTAEGRLTGTPAFMPPEAITGEQELDARADLYSLGCVAYWLLTGELVFDAKTPMKMAVAHATEAPLPPSRRSGIAVPEALERLVLRCLAKDPAERPANARALDGLLEVCERDAPWTSVMAEDWWTENLPELLHVDVAGDVRRHETAQAVIEA